MSVTVLSRDGKLVETGRISKVLAFRGLERTGVEEASAGDIVALSGLAAATVSDTVAAPEVTEALPAQPIDPPTLAMSFRINDGPFAGQDGDKVQSRVIRERLFREAEGNVALRISENADHDSFEVAGRGELQLGILIETMRREGFELTIGKPRVVFRTAPDGMLLEPIEEVIIDVDDGHAGVVVQKLSERRAELLEMRPSGGGRTRLVFRAPTRGLIGYHSELLSDTRGTAVFNRLFREYAPYKGEVPGRRNGVLIANSQGDATQYSLWYLEDRGALFIDPGVRVYEGMIVGEHSRENDLEVNVVKGKQLSNVRAAGKEDARLLTTPRRLSLEAALGYIGEDELVEVTPKSIRLRKTILDPHERKRVSRAGAA
jgi:GTP-binding protein